MSQMTLLALGPSWISNWLSPVWLVGVGALTGLAVLFLFWLLMLGLSRIPAVARVAEEPRQKQSVALVLAVVFFLALAGAMLLPSLTAARQAGAPSLTSGLILGVCLLIPVSVAAAFGVVGLCAPQVAREIPQAVREGPLSWIGTATLALAAFGVLGTFIAFEPMAVLASLARVPAVGDMQVRYTIPATPRTVLDDASQDPPQHPIDVRFRVGELRQLVFRSDQTLSIDVEPSQGIDVDPTFRVSPDESAVWVKRSETAPPFPQDEMRQLFVRNYSSSNANLDVTVVTRPVHPEAISVAVTALAVVVVFLAYVFQRAAMPKISAVALATFKSEVAQPLFTIMLVLGITSLALFIWIPYNTFGEDIKVLKDSGMTLIMVLCIIQAIWAASTSVADEIEGRTALTVLSKPIGRRSFIMGKYLGIFWTVAVLFIVLGLVFLVCVAYKPIYDSREGAQTDPTWQICHLEMMGVVPGLLLAFMETAVLAAISVAISTRMPMLANFIICFSIYVLGHLTPLVVQSSVSKFEPVRFVAELVATVLPILDHFNIQAAIAGGKGVPPDYLGWSLVYCSLYGIIALLLALVLFEDRDLA